MMLGWFCCMGPLLPPHGMVLSSRQDSQGRHPAAECGGLATTSSRNRVECRIASAGTAVHGSTQLNGNSIGTRKRLACTRVSYVNFARNTERKTYRERAPTIRLRHTR